ncbi:hypothetical protein [Nonomuraea sp. NPDC050202]|uniref:hypothetical protein n=1 Tax=Nonomuraea sp. NPDC050202 TaxID=3155035 RepID=UPI0033F5E5A1
MGREFEAGASHDADDQVLAGGFDDFLGHGAQLVDFQDAFDLVDEHLARQHPMATPAPPKKRSRAARAAQLTAGKTPLPQDDIGDRLFLYARELESLVAGGKLVRLLMRARLTSAET